MLLNVSATADMIKAEAGRRIEAIMPDYEQRNALALGQETIQLYGADPAGWPMERRAINDAIQAKWARINAIRAASNRIEQMNPVPADFRGDPYWTEEPAP